MRKRQTSKGGGQPTSSERRGEREAARHDEDDRDRQYRDESLALRPGHIRCGGGYLVRRKKIGGEE